MKTLVLRMDKVRQTPAAVALGFAAVARSDPKLDFIDKAFAVGWKNLKRQGRIERRLDYHMKQVLRCATIVAGRTEPLLGRAELLVEECTQRVQTYFSKTA